MAEKGLELEKRGSLNRAIGSGTDWVILKLFLDHKRPTGVNRTPLIHLIFS